MQIEELTTLMDFLSPSENLGSKSIKFTLGNEEIDCTISRVADGKGDFDWVLEMEIRYKGSVVRIWKEHYIFRSAAVLNLIRQFEQYQDTDDAVYIDGIMYTNLDR